MDQITYSAAVSSSLSNRRDRIQINACLSEIATKGNITGKDAKTRSWLGQVTRMKDKRLQRAAKGALYSHI